MSFHRRTTPQHYDFLGEGGDLAFFAFNWVSLFVVVVIVVVVACLQCHVHPTPLV